MTMDRLWETKNNVPGNLYRVITTRDEQIAAVKEIFQFDRYNVDGCVSEELAAQIDLTEEERKEDQEARLEQAMELLDDQTSVKDQGAD